MAQFQSDFLAQFPHKLRSDLQKFPELIEGLADALEKAPRLKWPPPNSLQDGFNHAIELLWSAETSKVVNLGRGMVESLNHANYLAFAVLFRAFFEQVVLFREYLIYRLSPTLASAATHGRVTTEELHKLVQELTLAVRRSKENWEAILAGDFGKLVLGPGSVVAWDKVSLKKHVENWAATQQKLGALDPLRLYDILCDLAHPNFGSSLLVLRLDEFKFSVRQHHGLIGQRIFGILYPSLAAVSMELQKLLNALLVLKFDCGQESDQLLN
jgi:hypothetical protein